MTTAAAIDLDEQPVIVLTRILDAPREIVWKAFADPTHLAKWWGGQGWTNPVCEMDFRPGGTWRQVMRAPDGTELKLTSVYLEIVEPERLVWRSAGDDAPARGAPPEVIHCVTFEDLGRKTRWTLVSRFGSLDERDTAAKMGFANVITQSIGRLAEYLEAR
jgi:uncharacterized protein YndB with AHSA1/START domain